MNPAKKQALQRILEALIPYWDLAEGFLIILQEEGNDELIEKLYQEIFAEIRKISSEEQQEKIKTALQKLRERSDAVTKSDEEDVNKILDDFIDNI